jgi:hypothetical protein
MDSFPDRFALAFCFCLVYNRGVLHCCALTDSNSHSPSFGRYVVGQASLYSPEKCRGW